MLAYINAIHSMHWGINPPPPPPSKTPPLLWQALPLPLNLKTVQPPIFRQTPPPPYILVISDHKIEIFHP